MTSEVRFCTCGHQNQRHGGYVGPCRFVSSEALGIHLCDCQEFRDVEGATMTNSFPWPDGQWLRCRISDLKASLRAEEALGRNTGLVHAARRMIRFLEDQEELVKKDHYCDCCGRSALAVIMGTDGTCTTCLHDEMREQALRAGTIMLEDWNEMTMKKSAHDKVTSEDEKLNLSDWDKLNNEVIALTGNNQVHDKHILSLFEKVGTLTELVQTLEAGWNTEYTIVHDNQRKLTETLESQLNSIQNLHDAVQVITRTVAPYGGTLDAHKDTLGTHSGLLEKLLNKTESHDRSVERLLNGWSDINKSIAELQKKPAAPDVTLADKATVNPVVKDATSKMLLKRFLAVQRICEASIDLDNNKDNPDVYPYRNRQWLAQSVLNILNGNVDE